MSRLLKRLGYIKLSDYGLWITPDGKVEPIRPEPALMLAPPAPKRVAQIMPVSAPVTAAVAPEPVVEEDDWEWQIAIARVRAEAADEVAQEIEEMVEQSVIHLDAPKVIALDTPKRQPSNTRPMALVPPPLPPPPVSIKAGQEPGRSSGKTVPYAENPFHQWEGKDSRTPRCVVKTVARRSMAETVIPVPKLPQASQTAAPRKLEPVVRAPVVPPTLRRMAKGTGVGEDTVRTAAAPDELPAEEKTHSGMVLPSVARRAAARQP